MVRFSLMVMAKRVLFDEQRVLEVSVDRARARVERAAKEAFGSAMVEVAPNVWRQSGTARDIEVRLESEGRGSKVTVYVGAAGSGKAGVFSGLMTALAGLSWLIVGFAVLSMLLHEGRGWSIGTENAILAAVSFPVALVLSRLALRFGTSRYVNAGDLVERMGTFMAVVDAVSDEPRVAKGYRIAPLTDEQAEESEARDLEAAMAEDEARGHQRE